jgi:CubicO group peptidase (beta-lactamase class C family)
MTSITVNELLHHTCGGWSDDWLEAPKFRDTSITRDQLMGWIIDNIPLKNKPGTSYGFSNFGYLVLGRVIEKITRQSYTTFVNDSILKPAGILDMELAGRFENKKKNEVTYYKFLNTFPIYNKELDEELFFYRTDACSGWIASATDMLKLVDAVNGSISKDDILDSATRRIMLTSSRANEHFACGWFLNDDFKNLYFISDHFGQASEIVKAANGFSWSILVNASRPADPNYLNDLDQIVWKVIGNPAIKWPDKNTLPVKPVVN